MISLGKAGVLPMIAAELLAAGLLLSLGSGWSAESR